MTLSAAATRTDQVGNGANRVFFFNFKTFDTSHVEVYVGADLQATGLQVVLNSDQTSAPGGTVTFDTAPTAGVTVRIQRVVPVTQDSAWAPFASFRAEALEAALDRIVMEVQEEARNREDEATARADADAANSTADREYADAQDAATLATAQGYTDAQIVGATNLAAAVAVPQSWSFTGDGTAVSYAVTGADVSAAALYTVTLDGVLQTPTTDYTVNSTTQQITFASAPPYGTAINVRCFGYSKPFLNADDSLVTATGAGAPRRLADHLATLPDTLVTATHDTVARSLSAISSRVNDAKLGMLNNNRATDLRKSLFYILGGRRFDWTPRQGAYALPLYYGGDRGEPLTFTRATTGTVIDIFGVEQTASSGNMRTNARGFLIERRITNLCSAPDAPATETINLPGGKYYAWIEGSGSIGIANSTATGVTGLPATITAGAPVSFAVGGAGNVVFTKTGTVTFAQYEFQAYAATHKTSKIHTGGATRNADIASFDVAFNGATWAIDCTFSPIGAWDRGANPPVYGVWSLGATGYNSNEASLSFQGASLVFLVVDSSGGARSIAVNVGALGLAADSQHRVTCTHDSATGAMAFYFDGVLKSATPTGAGTAKWTTKPSVCNVGARNPSAGAFLEEALDGYIHALSFFPLNDPAINAESIGLVKTDLALLGDSRAFLAISDFINTLGPEYYITQEGFSGNQTSDVLTRWTARVRGQRHRYIVLQVGVNNFGNGGTAAAAWADVKTILDQATADGTWVIATTVFPFKGAGYYTVGRDAERIAFNATLTAYCATLPNCTLVDTATLMDDGAGALQPAYDSGDHLHLSNAGNVYFAQLCQPYIIQ